jgi:hypothetical protein
MSAIIESQGFHVNPKKTRLQKNGYRKEVTGLVVNDKVNVRRRYVKQIRRWLYLWERYGYVQAEAIFRNDYRADKGYVKKGEPSLQNVLDGKLLFLKMVKGEGDGTYVKLLERFVNLTNNLEQVRSENVDLDSVLDVLVNKGLDDAMNLFDKFKSIGQ